MIRYQRNNIIFRIASSDAISKFKHAQAHAFVQLARSDLKFDISAREVVLLEYDRISQWLYRIERILQSSQEGEMSEQLRTAITESLHEELTVIQTVLETHTDVFDLRVTEYTKLIHEYSFPIIEDELDCKLNDTIDRGFASLSDLVSEYLQHLLLCLHEYNNNCILKNNPAFISVGEFSASACSKQSVKKFIPSLKRLEFFKKQGCGDHYIFKNYTSQDDMFDQVVKSVKPAAVTLVPEEPVTEELTADSQKLYAYA